MATIEDVRHIAMLLPETEPGKSELSWTVRKKTFAWERPLRKKDLAELGLEEQTEPVWGLRCTHERKALLTGSEPEIFFATSHFEGWPAVLVWLDRIGVDELAEVMEEAWLVQAPKTLAIRYLAEREIGQA